MAHMEGHCLINNWYVEDVYNIAKVAGIEKPSKEVAVKVLKLAARSHDANIGINNEVILLALQEILGDDIKELSDG